MTDPTIEYKTIAEEFKATGDKGEYDGHFNIFSNIDDGLDIMHPGAFTKTIQERRRRIKVFYAHNWEKLVGPPPTIIEEDSIGLRAEGRLTLDSFWGRETWVLLKDGALSEGSIGFLPVKWDWEDSGIRHLREVKLYEISFVPLGMNPLTNIEAVKTLQRARDAREKLEVFSALVQSLTDADITAENADAWEAAASEVAGRLAAFSNSSEGAAAEPREHSALLRRELRWRAAELALSRATIDLRGM